MRKRKPEEQKNSGVEWIGKIPMAWRVIKLKFVSIPQTSNVDKKTKDGEIDVELCNYTDVYYNEFITNGIEFMKASATKDQISKFRLNVGDVIFTKDSESPEDIAVPALVKETKENLICGYHLAQIKPKSQQVNGGFLFRLFQSDLYSEEFGNRSNGITRYGLGTYELKNIDVLLPSLPEQHAIATFLDRKTQAIDQLIEKKQQLIEKLKEKRQALITRAVTKGLNPDAPMKDSGIEWLGEIPEHWDVLRIGALFREVDRRNYPNLPLLKVSIHDGVKKKDLSEKKIHQTASDFNSYKRANKGNLAFNKMRAWQGAIGVVPVDGLISPDYTVMEQIKKISNNFYNTIFRTNNFLVEIDRNSYGIVKDRNRLYWQYFKTIKVPFPKYREQVRINDFISNLSKKIELSTQKTIEQIEKLKEYRQSLISAAVTGKIDVRDEVEVLAE